MQTNDSVGAWRRALAIAVRSVKRDRGTLGTVVLFSGMIFFAGVVLLSAAAASELRQFLLAQTQISLAVKAGTADQDVQAFYGTLSALPGVQSVRFLPQEQALEQQREMHPDLAQFLDRYQLQNPFPDLFLITLRSPAALPALRSLLQEGQGGALVQGSALTDLLKQEQDIARVQTVAASVQSVTVWMSALTAILLLLLIADMASARLRERRMDRQTVLLLGGGFMEADGAVLLETLLLVSVSVLIAVGGLLLLLHGGIALLPELSADAVLSQFLSGVTETVWLSVPYLALFLLCAVPVAVFVAMGIARWRTPLLVYGTRA